MIELIKIATHKQKYFIYYGVLVQLRHL